MDKSIFSSQFLFDLQFSFFYNSLCNFVGTIWEGTVEGRKREGREILEYAEQIIDNVGYSGYCDITILAQDRNKVLSRVNIYFFPCVKFDARSKQGQQSHK